MADFRNRLHEALALRNMKAVDLCNKTNIPKSAISYYLAGKSKPKSDRLYLIAKALDVSEAWLLGYDVEATRSEAQKKNDDLAQIVKRLRKDTNFYKTVSALYMATDNQLSAINQLLTTFGE